MWERPLVKGVRCENLEACDFKDFKCQAFEITPDRFGIPQQVTEDWQSAIDGSRDIGIVMRRQR